MIRVGAVNIDTSHPMGFADSMKKDGRMRYVGVYNDSFRSDAEVAGFMARYGLEKRCETLDELADMCDIGFVQGCNWDDHLRCAMPFIRRGKPVFLDKPAVGCLADCREVRRLVREGAVILGSSSARYAYEVQDFLAKSPAERGETVTVLASSGVDEFNYGIHIAETIGGLMGPGAESVRYMGRGEAAGQYSESWFVHFADGRSAVYTTLTGAWQPFGVIVITTKSTFQFCMDPSRLYDALIEQVANFLEGKPHRLAPIEDVLESVQIMLAGAASRAAGGKTVALRDLREDGPSFDGPAFWKKYGAASGPMYAL
ncbi:MAG TPA: hypothetical protein H9883_06535 [Candidatus Ruthenibacterium merdigallinarum]|nr:hypothetical protein [Candidatus Ruthenibacterium merdigallinarum]